MIHKERNSYLEKLVNSKNNGLVKIITGIRRCGKSYLLFFNIAFNSLSKKNKKKFDFSEWKYYNVIDDLILNFIGIIIGYFIVRLLRKKKL